MSWLWDVAASRGVPEKLHHLQAPAPAEQMEILPITEVTGALGSCRIAIRNGKPKKPAIPEENRKGEG